MKPSEEAAIERRQFLRASVAAMAAASASTLIVGVPRETAAQTGGQIAGFSVDIPDAPNASAAIREVRMEPLVFDAKKAKPGKPLYGDVHLIAAKPSNGAPSELETWFREAAAGSCARKDITVSLLAGDGTVARSYSLYDCFPTQWSSVNFDTSSTVQTETLTVKIGRVEFKT